MFVPSENQTTSVSCHERKGNLHSVSVKDGRLEIKIEDTRKWYEHIGISFDTPKITVYLPQSEYGKLSVKTITGRIDIRNISADSLDLTVSTGKVAVSNTDCKGDVKVEVSTGKAVLTNIRCKNALSSGDTGDISLNNVIATEKLSVERSTGDVEFDGSDAAEIYIKTTTGKVTGSLLSDKVFITDTATGKVDVPKTVGGGKCEINTSTGNIKITVETEYIYTNKNGSENSEPFY